MKHVLMMVFAMGILSSASPGHAACVVKNAVHCLDGTLAPQDPVTCEWLSCPDSKTDSAVDRLKQAVHAHNGNRICTQPKILLTCTDGSPQAQNPETCEMIPCPSEKICPQNRNMSLCSDGSMQAQDPKTCKMIPCPDNKTNDALYGALNDAGLIKCEGKVCSGSISSLKCQSPTPLGSAITKCSFEDSSGDTQTIRGAKANKLFSEAKHAKAIAVDCAKGICTSEATTISCSQRGAKATAGAFQECAVNRTKDLEDMSQIPDDRNVEPGNSNLVR